MCKKITNSPKYFFPLFLILTAVFPYLNTEAQIDSRLRVGTLSTDATHKLVIVGIQSRPETQSSDLDFRKLGFQGQGLNHLDPKFLLEVGPDGVSQVRSFELENLQEDEVKDPCPQARLPVRLLNVTHAKSDKWGHAILNSCISAGKSLGFPIALGTSLGAIPRKRFEELKKFQAYYLLELIHKSLPPYHHYQELKAALSPDPLHPELGDLFLKRLGQALLIRYNPKSNWAGLGFSNQPDGEAYLDWRNRRYQKRIENKGYFLKRADELGLEVASVDNDFGILLIPSKNDSGNDEISPPYHPEFMSLASAKIKPEEVLKRLRHELSKDASQPPLVPWTLVSYVNPDSPVDLVDFILPTRFSKNLYELSHWRLWFDLGGSIIPFSNWLLFNPIRKIIEHETYKSRNPKYVKRIESFGSVLALAETHFDTPTLPSRLNLEGIGPEQFDSALKPFGLSYRPTESMEPQDETARTSNLLNDVTALLISEMERRSRHSRPISWEEVRATKSAYYLYLDSFIKDLGIAQPPPPSRGPSSLGTPEEVPEPKPVILLLIDGLKPDRFKKAALNGWMPHLKALFFDRGTELLSFTSRSLTLPSWSTILTGFEPDVHGIRSNTPTSRLKEKVVSNYEDPRLDLLDPKNREKNRAYQHLELDRVGEEGKVYLPDYFEKNQRILTYLPVSRDSGGSSVWSAILQLFKHRIEFLTETDCPACLLDENATKFISESIQKDRGGKLRLVVIWFAGVDSASHNNNLMLPKAYKTIDEGVGLVLDAARNHAVLKDATVFVISDHGHTGGYEAFDRASLDHIEAPFSANASHGINEGPLLANTGFNITRFLAGQYKGYTRYSFTVGTAHPTAPKFDLGFLEEFQLQPFRWTYPSHSGGPNALLDATGENMANIYIRKAANVTPTPWPPLSYYELTHFQLKKDGPILNFPRDFLQFEIPNLMISDKQLALKIIELSERHPVEFFAMPLIGPKAKEFFEQLASTDSGAPTSEPSTRNPVLVMARNRTSSTPLFRTGIILTRSTPDGRDFFKYLVVRNFDQTAEGEFQAQISTRPEDDPIGYLDTVVPREDSFSRWRTDEEWLELAKRHVLPTALFSIPRALTLADRYTDPAQTLVSEPIKELRLSEIPDFLVLASRGYAFHSDTPLESDHGGLSYEEVRNSFFVSALNPERFKVHREIPQVILNRDMMPTILDFAGWGRTDGRSSPLPRTQGRSYRPMLEPG